MSSTNLRFLALNILCGYIPGRTNLSNVINKTLLHSKDAGFARDLVRGTVSRLNTLDFYINTLSKKPKAIDKNTRNILRLGVYQLLYMKDRVPEYAAVDESVNLAGSSKKIKGYVNALLWELIRKKDKIALEISVFDQVKRMSLQYSYPDWVVSRWIKRFGPADAEKLCAAGNVPPKISVRTNTLRISSRENLLKELENEGVSSEYAQFSGNCLNLNENPELEKLETYRKGYFTVQDEASQLIVQILDPKAGEVVVDLCCGSGTKSTHISQLTCNAARVIAVDMSQEKIKAAKNNAERLGCKNIYFLSADILKPENNKDLIINNSKADKVLIDVPCSGFGVIRRKPDIKWNRQKNDIEKKLPEIQEKLLAAGSKILRPGGILVYSTCSTEPEEGEYVIKRFLLKNKNYEQISIGNFMDFVKSKNFRTFPHKYPMDGFFAAKLTRVT